MTFIELAEIWENIARRKFHDADRTEDTIEKRGITHGAMCYFNCASELREVLGRPLHTETTILSIGQK